MKKTQFIFVAMLVIGVFLAGCSHETENSPVIHSSSASLKDKVEKGLEESNSEKVPASLLAGEESDRPESSEQTGEMAGSVVLQQEAGSHTQTETQHPAETPVQKQAAVEAQPKRPANQPPVSNPQPEAPSAVPTPTPAPIPTLESTPEPEPTPSFDVSSYVEYAKSYGQSVALSLDSTANACWDNPINANAGSKYLERDIRDLLDWYAADGHTAFWVWAENLGGGEYLIYIGYA